jgi:hypothetical protein
VRLTPAGEQIERALATGYDVAAFNLYADAIENDVTMAEPDDGSDAEAAAVAQWHRRTQQRISWAQGTVLTEDDGSIIATQVYERNDDGTVIGEGHTEYDINPEVE